ncbi:unnamed protein product [Acanthoscelides obtectus]|uniref:Uncharacterized protein n=1 Tax=Acanthoscelides obtectus TaxID=200917 RepID=A0A9P0KPQ9_ACAOB|nr:unnamed protein product [Acanthoscelides obtectus]CAK1664791.1 hypothetical protein AOBTE_LOCUS24467 [Acanthoscelides obtectus]
MFLKYRTLYSRSVNKLDCYCPGEVIRKTAVLSVSGIKNMYSIYFVYL